MASGAEPTRAITAHYIEEMLKQLRTMSVGIQAELLTYFLEMALIEASDIVSQETDHDNFQEELMNVSKFELRPKN